MNGFLDQLSTRSLESTSLSIRPRMLSRFEADGSSADEVAQDAIAATPTVTGEQSPTRAQHIETDANPPQSNVDKPLVPPSDRLADDDLVHRLDRLDRQIIAIARSETSMDRIAQAPPSSPPSVASVHHSETHLYHQHQTQQIHPTRVIENSTERVVSESQPPQLPQSDAAIPQVAVDPIPRDQRDSAQPMMPLIERHIESMPKAPTPQIVVQRVEEYLPVPAQDEEVPAAQPVPQIVVEKQPAETASHTVTVTIGRIEVRPPKRDTPPTQARQRPKPRIMSLDDYVRRRAGGAS